LVAAFTTPFLLAVRYRGTDLGSIDPVSIEGRRSSLPVILLGGRSWRVVDVDWPRRTVSVEPTSDVGRSRWFGSSRPLRSELARAVERVLATGDCGVMLSSRAGARLEVMRDEMPYVDAESLPLVADGEDLRIWTFAGGRANAMLAGALQSAGASLHNVDNFGLTLRRMKKAALVATFDKIAHGGTCAPIHAHTLVELKFGICLPEHIAEDVLQVRLSDSCALQQCLQRPRRWIRLAASHT
jgi:ATP-dependent helicase Lhr and Lhr-like helicase